MTDENDGDGRPGPGYGRRYADDKSVVFVGGINWKASEADLLEFFNDEIGPAIHCRIIFDRETNRSKGYGFVTFASPDLARDAKETDPPLVFMGKTLNCQSAYRRASSISQSRPAPAPALSPASYPYYPAMYVDSLGMLYVAQNDGFCWYPPQPWSPPSSYPSMMPQESYYRYSVSIPRLQGELSRDKPRSPRINIPEESRPAAIKDSRQISNHRGEITPQNHCELPEGNKEKCAST